MRRRPISDAKAIAGLMLPRVAVRNLSDVKSRDTSTGGPRSPSQSQERSFVSAEAVETVVGRRLRWHHSIAKCRQPAESPTVVPATQLLLLGHASERSRSLLERREPLAEACRERDDLLALVAVECGLPGGRRLLTPPDGLEHLRQEERISLVGQGVAPHRELDRPARMLLCVSVLPACRMHERLRLPPVHLRQHVLGVA